MTARRRSLALIGVPWNPDELVGLAADADALGARLSVVDTPLGLGRVPPGADCDRIAVPAVELELLVDALGAARPDAVLSLSEPRLALTAQVRDRLGLPGTSARAETVLVDKFLCRQALSAAGLTQVTFAATSLGKLRVALRDAVLPVVVKPRALAGGNGVRLVEAEADAEKLLADFVPGAAAFDHDELLIESYIPGEEISAEAIVIDGKLLLLALTDKINSGSPYFQECGHIVPSRHRHLQADVSAYLQATVTALGMVTAPLHAELKIVGDRLEIVELNVRFGGGNIVRLVSGAMKVRPFRLYLDALLGGRPDEDAYTPDVVWGVGFFTARVGETLSWPSYAFPRPECVTELDMRADRQPKLTDFGGVRIRYWRPGHALFSSPDYQAVRANIEFMAAQTPG